MPGVLHSLPYFVAAWLLLCGLYGIVTSKHLVHAVVCLAILQSSTYMLLLAIGYRVRGSAPIFVDISTSKLVVDPVVQPRTLAPVVAEAVVVALLRAMVVKAHEKSGSVSPNDLRPMRG